jgi:Domain of unknown function (DUF4157)
MNAQLELQTTFRTISKPLYTPVAQGTLQRATIQPSSLSPHPSEAPPSVRDVLPSPGQPLDAGSRAFMEPQFSHDFSRISTYIPAVQRIQTKLAINEPGDKYEQEANRIADQVMMGVLPGAELTGPQLTSSPSMIRRAFAGKVAQMPETETTAGTNSAGLIADDDTGELGPGQMRKSEFLDELQRAICAAADAELAAVGRSTNGCPYLEKWMGYYRTREGQQVERTVRRYAPETAGVTTARGYIPLIRERVRQAVAVWARTGEFTGVPEGVSPKMPGAGTETGAEETRRTTGSVQFKGCEGSVSHADNPRAIQAQLGSGAALNTGFKSRMESAFGHDFSRVRVHTDNHADELSRSLNARAFTIGSDIAFASGEYQPGTLIGDALIAHELAHVAQQGAATSEPMHKSSSDYNGLEEDADRSAVGATVSLWSGVKSGMAAIAANAMPRLRAGLRVQRCGSSSTRQGPVIPTLLRPEYVSNSIYRPCGEFFLFINWFTNGRLGYIVQEITNTYSVKDCAGAADTSDAPTPHFYEAWEVDARGNVTPELVSPNGRVNDKWSRPPRTEANGTPGSQGNWSTKGKVYWAATLDPAASFRVGAVYDAHDLLSTTIRPNNLGKVFKEHGVAGKWNCCGGANDHDPV